MSVPAQVVPHNVYCHTNLHGGLVLLTGHLLKFVCIHKTACRGIRITASCWQLKQAEQSSAGKCIAIGMVQTNPVCPVMQHRQAVVIIVVLIMMS